MTLLILGVGLFFGVHSLKMIPPCRRMAISLWGEKGQKAVVGIGSLLGIVFIVLGMRSAPDVHLWATPEWGRWVAFALTWPAMILFPAANMPSNVKRYTRHPMLWGMVLWSAGHLFANGDLAGVILFGSFAGWSLIDMVSANLRGEKKSDTVLPLQADLKIVAMGTATWIILILLHPWIFGIDILP